MIILPVGSDISVRRLPKITIAIIALNVLIFFFISLPNMTRVKEERRPIDYQLKAITYPYWSEQVREGNYKYNRVGYYQFRQDFKEGNIISKDSEDYIRYIELSQELDKVLSNSIKHQLGYIPNKITIQGLFGHMFLHGGFGHLFGNMWFLWLVGVNLEDRWGRWTYLVFYLIAGIAAAIGFGLMAKIKGVPAIGASGAIAGLMGAFSVRFFKSKVKYFYFILFFLRPIWGTFELAAWFAMGLWFFNQVLQNQLFGSISNVAFTAHIIGFLFGASIAIGLIASGIEKKYIKKIVYKEKALDSKNPLVDEAQDSIDKGEYGEARNQLEEAVKINPHNTSARMKLIDVYCQYISDMEKGFFHFNKLLETFRLKNDPIHYLFHFNNYYNNFPKAIFPEKNFYYLAFSYGADNNFKFALEGYKQFARNYPKSPLLPKVLFNAARIYIYKTNEIQLGQKMLYVILKRFPMLPWKNSVEDELEKIKKGNFTKNNLKSLEGGSK